jgi:hypothetical protein
VTQFGLTFSLARAIGPILKPLNRELAKRKASAVVKEEYAFIDDVLHEEQEQAAATPMSCPHCGGVLQPDVEEGEYTCLICARSTSPRRDVDQLAERLADRILEYRSRQG